MKRKNEVWVASVGVSGKNLVHSLVVGLRKNFATLFFKKYSYIRTSFPSCTYMGVAAGGW